MLAALLLVLAQAAQQQDPSPIAKAEVTPTAADVEVGQTLQLGVRVLEQAGKQVPNARVQWFDGGGQGSIDSTGLLTAGYQGKILVTAVASVGNSKPTFGRATVMVKPEAATRVVLDRVPSK